jgi:hypothetical protein
MNVRDLTCWPPRWRRAAGPSGEVTSGERGVLIAARWDHKTRSIALIMEDEGDRHLAVLEGEGRVLSKLSLLLDWQVGRPLAVIGGLEMTP